MKADTVAQMSIRGSAYWFGGHLSTGCVPGRLSGLTDVYLR